MLKESLRYLKHEILENRAPSPCTEGNNFQFIFPIIDFSPGLESFGQSRSKLFSFSFFPHFKNFKRIFFSLLDKKKIFKILKGLGYIFVDVGVFAVRPKSGTRVSFLFPSFGFLYGLVRDRRKNNVTRQERRYFASVFAKQ